MKDVKRSPNRKAGSSKRMRTARRRASVSSRHEPKGPAPGDAATKSRYLRPKLNRFPKTKAQLSRVRIPPVLLEGDTPGTPSALRQLAPSEPASRPVDDARTIKTLPEAYGTQRLKLTPRDPHWIHAHWDFTRQQLAAASGMSAEGELVLRVYERDTRGPLVSETRVAPGAVRWLVHAPRAAASYAAELGFYDARHQWSALAGADPVRTPPASPSADRGFEVATWTPGGQLQRHGTPTALKSPERLPETGSPVSDEGFQSVGLALPGSFAQAGVFPEAPSPPPSSPGVSGWSSAGPVSSLSSPLEAAPQRTFRLEVNAEVVLYGATEPNATLRLGHRIIPLNADGTFRLRFALPDGVHEVRLSATAAGTGEERSANLHIQRHTDATGNVGSAPTEPGLRPAPAENL